MSTEPPLDPDVEEISIDIEESFEEEQVTIEES